MRAPNGFPFLLTSLSLALWACGGDGAHPSDATTPSDSGNAQPDASTLDAAAADSTASIPDAGTPDTGAIDAGERDAAAPVDSGPFMAAAHPPFPHLIDGTGGVFQH